MSAFKQDRIRVDIRVLVDAEEDWMQWCFRVTGVEERHLLRDVVHHAEPLHELGHATAHHLLELVDMIREETGTRPAG